MRLPEFCAEGSLSDRTHRRRTARRARPLGGAVRPQAARGYGRSVSMEECWQRCFNTPWDCPTECANVPWPTIPPQPKRIVF
jgi:hypothetical protein